MTGLFAQPPDYPTMVFVDRRTPRTAAQRWYVWIVGLLALLGMICAAWFSWTYRDLPTAGGALLFGIVGGSLWREIVHDGAYAWAIRNAPQDAMAHQVAKALHPALSNPTTIHHDTPISVLWLVEGQGLLLLSTRMGVSHMVEAPAERPAHIPYASHRAVWRLLALLHRSRRLVLVANSLITIGSAHHRLARIDATPRFLPLDRHHTPRTGAKGAGHV